MNIIEIVAIYYVFVAVFVGGIGSLALTLGNVYDMDSVLSDIRETLRCIFMYQFEVYELLEDEINKTGIIILEVFVTLNVWFLNILALAIVICLWLIKMICHCFWLVFRKRGDKDADYD